MGYAYQMMYFLMSHRCLVCFKDTSKGRIIEWRSRKKIILPLLNRRLRDIVPKKTEACYEIISWKYIVIDSINHVVELA